MSALDELVAAGTRIKLVIAVYAASPTDAAVLTRVQQLSEGSADRAEFSILARPLSGNAGGMTALLLTNPSGTSHLWIGNSPNLALQPSNGGHLNVACEAHQVLTGKFVEWFADFWQQCSRLTPVTASVPALVPAAGSQDAARSWIAYEQLCKSRGGSTTEPGPEDQAERVGRDDGQAPPAAEPETQDSLVATLCKELNIAPPDPLKARVASLLGQGEIVTIDKNSRTPPMELPLRFGDEGETVGSISRTSSYRIKIFDDLDSKELEKRRNGVADLIQRFTYPLADGMRWIPKKAQPLLERERTRLEHEARDLINALVGDSATEFAKARRDAIAHDLDSMYAKIRPGAGKVPVSTLNLVLRDLEARLAKATQGEFLPKVTYMSAEFSARADSEHISQWAHIRTLLSAAAEYFRKATIGSSHLKGLEISEEEILDAMDVCGDWMARQSRNSKTEKAAKAELLQLEEIQASDLDDRAKCMDILALIENSKGRS